MKFAALLTILVGFTLFIGISESANILGYFITFSKSHLMVHRSVMQELINRGHNVTIVTTLPLENSKKTFRHLQLKAPEPPKEFITGIMKKAKGAFGFLGTLMGTTDFMLQYNNASLHDPQMKRLMAEESFDLVVFGYFFNSFQIGVGMHFKCPVVISFMHRPMNQLNDMVGNPLETTYVPHMVLGLSQPLDFLGRIKNLLLAVIMDMGVFSFIDYKSKRFYDYNFPSETYPPYEEALKNISLVLSNYHFTNGVVRPNVPAIVEIGGIQIKPDTEPLPDDIKDFLDGASKDGAVYFSLGSNARSADMNSETIKILYNVLSELKQRVIWKWEEDTPPGNAANILFKKWLPQDDILAHPNIRLFITHGGHGSVVESEYHGVPMVGIPLFADQFSNMDGVQKAGYGLSLGKEEITAEKFKSIVEEVLYNPTYRNKVQEFSRIYRDRPMSARDTAAYWIEYVIRHRGAKHMQSPAVHMNFIQLYGLDVFAFLFVLFYVMFKTLAFVFRKVVHLLFGRKSKDQNKESNKHKKDQ